MRRLLSVTFFSGLLTLVRMGSGFLVAKMLALYAGPSGLAMLGQVQSLVTSVNGLVNAPVSHGVVRFTAEFNHAGIAACSPWWRASLWWLTIILGIVMPPGLLFAGPIAHALLHNSDYGWVIQITTLLLPLTAMGTLFNSVLNGFQHFHRYIALGMLSSLLSCLLMVMLIATLGINGALLAAAIQASLTGVLLLVALHRQPWCKLSSFCGASRATHRKKTGGYILMAIVSALAVPLAIISVRNLIVSHAGWEHAGQWQAVWKISEVYLGVITLALSTHYLPTLATLKGRPALRREIANTAILVIPLAALLALGIYLLRDLIISLLFTPAFQEARHLFAIQLMGDLLKITGWLYVYPMIAGGAITWFVITEIIFSASLVVLSTLLIPLYLTQGATIAYSLNYFLYLVFAMTSLRFFVK